MYIKEWDQKEKYLCSVKTLKKRPGGKQQRQLRHETCMGTFMGTLGKSTKIKKKILNKSQLSRL